MSVHTTSTTDDEITKALYATLLKPLVVQWIGRILAEDVMWVRFLPRGHEVSSRSIALQCVRNRKVLRGPVKQDGEQNQARGIFTSGGKGKWSWEVSAWG